MMHAAPGPPAEYSELVAAVRLAIRRRLATAVAGEVLQPYFERGKMFRAQVVFAAAAAVGGDPRDAAAAAEAIELLHGASLVHDDIIDGAAQRRGLPSLHERLGVGRAVVVGDDLLLLAFEVLGESRATHPLARVVDAIDALNQLARVCCRGQFDELAAERWIVEDEYFAIVRGKTAAPFVAAGTLGALFGGGTADAIARLRCYAEHLGVAFQVGDDLLDLLGEAHALGKPVGNSLDRGRPMLPLIELARSASPERRAEIQGILGGSEPRARLSALVREAGVLERVDAAQQRHVDAAVEALQGLPGSDGVAALRALARAAAQGLRAAPQPQAEG